MKHASWYQAPSLMTNVSKNKTPSLLTKAEITRSNILGILALAVMIAPFFWAFVENLSN